DLGAPEAAWVAGAVPPLMVRGHYLAGDAAERGNRGDDPLADPRMLADLVDLVRRQRARLHQRRVRDADHPDVVKTEAVRELRIQHQLGRDLFRELQGELRHAR